MQRDGEFGMMRESVSFDRPNVTRDEYGGTVEGWTEGVYSCNADFQYLRGGETVQAARLTGRQPVLATIYSSAGAREVGTDWRLIDLRRNKSYAIRSIEPDDEGGKIRLVCERGVAE